MGSIGGTRATLGGRPLPDKAPSNALIVLDSITIFNARADKNGAFPPFFHQDSAMELKPADLPDDIDALKAMLLAERARNAEGAALIAHLQLRVCLEFCVSGHPAGP